MTGIVTEQTSLWCSVIWRGSGIQGAEGALGAGDASRSEQATANMAVTKLVDMQLLCSTACFASFIPTEATSRPQSWPLTGLECRTRQTRADAC